MSRSPTSSLSKTSLVIANEDSAFTNNTPGVTAPGTADGHPHLGDGQNLLNNQGSYATINVIDYKKAKDIDR